MIPSPCIELCRIAGDSTLCLGCGRTRAEVAIWGEAHRDFRARVWAELPARRERLGLRMHRVGWDLDELRAFIALTLQTGGGTWVSGVHGAVAAFSVGGNEPVELEVGETEIAASTSRGAISFRLSDRFRALATGSSSDPSRADNIVLAVPRAKAGLSSFNGLTRLGPDTEAIGAKHRADTLYDLGLGRLAAGFGVRVSDPSLISRLDESVGLEWSKLLSSLGGQILDVSPTRVVRTPSLLADGRGALLVGSVHQRRRGVCSDPGEHSCLTAE